MKFNQKLNSKFSRTKIAPMIKDLQSKVQSTVSNVQSSVHSTVQTVQSNIPSADQVLLGLTHTGQSIPTLLKQTFRRIEGNPNDLIGRVGRTVFERAQTVRDTLVARRPSSTKAKKSEVGTVLTAESSATESAVINGASDAPKAAKAAAKKRSAATTTKTAKKKPATAPKKARAKTAKSEAKA